MALLLAPPVAALRILAASRICDAAMDPLAAWIESRADEMAGLLADLVAVDTENPPGRGLGACAAVLRDALDDLGLSPHVIAVPPAGELEDPCVVRAVAGDGPRTVYFHGHFDVVPGQRRDQFASRRRDGRVVGRGTADMKGGLVSMAYGAAAARELGLLTGGRIVLHLVCDEETGSTAGSGHLRDSGLIDPAAVAMLTPEPTGGLVWHASRGAITLRVELTGRERRTSPRLTLKSQRVRADVVMRHVPPPVRHARVDRRPAGRADGCARG
jgi:succinyl-diaminopimelate desuccinylase